MKSDAQNIASHVLRQHRLYSFRRCISFMVSDTGLQSTYTPTNKSKNNWLFNVYYKPSGVRAASAGVCDVRISAYRTKAHFTYSGVKNIVCVRRTPYAE